MSDESRSSGPKRAAPDSDGPDATDRSGQTRPAPDSAAATDTSPDAKPAAPGAAGAANKGGWVRQAGPAKAGPAARQGGNQPGGWAGKPRPGPGGQAGQGGPAGQAGPAARQGGNQPGGWAGKPRPGPGGPQAWRQGQGAAGQGPAQAGQAVADQVVTVMPIASPAEMKRRHWGLLLSFLLMVLIPLGAVVFYLWTIAEDRYGSITGFTVRQEESGGATDLLGGLANFTGGTVQSDSDILYEFIQSQALVESVDAELDLRAHYGAHWPDDWAFALWPDATLEELIWYWQRIVRISYDQSTGLIEVQVLAYDPDMAQRIGEKIVAESQVMINKLNERAREDAMRYAVEDLEDSVERLKTAREALTQFRTRTRIVDPEADIQSRMGVMSNLQQKLAEALIEYDLLLQSVSENDPRVAKARDTIDVIRDRIAAERQTFTSDSTETGAVGEDYPTLIAEFESLSVDREVAEQTYRAALTALDVARANAARQSRYLATYIPPTRSQTPEYPQRLTLTGLAALFLLLVWSILALVYYSIRDRR